MNEEPAGEEALAGAETAADDAPTLSDLFAACAQWATDGRAYARTVKDLALTEARVSAQASLRIVAIGVLGWSMGTVTLLMLSLLAAYLVAEALDAGWGWGLLAALALDLIVLAVLGALAKRYLRLVGFRRSREALQRGTPPLARYPAAAEGAAP